MMPKFFFNLNDGSVTLPDDVGRDLPSLDAARHEAIADIVDVMRTDFKLMDKNWATWSLCICEEDGNVLVEIPFMRS
jgi:hypothetical protein